MKTSSYINRDKLPYPFCPGCSHGPVLDRIDEAMVRLKLDADKVVVVTDIGCTGLSDQWFTTHAFHGLHGRSVAYGEGLKLAAPELKVLVLIGDGGAGIGGHHLLNAAKRNIGMSVILFNNMNFGMTGGEHSITTPEGSVTSTTVAGHFESPLRLCETLSVNSAPFVARRAYYDKDLTDVIEKAIAFDGFSFVEVMEFCTAYYVPFNKFSKKQMENILSSENLPRMTLIDESRTEYSKGYRDYCLRLKAKKSSAATSLEKKYNHNVRGVLDIAIAGSAGMKISSSAARFARAAILSGLYVAQRDDYPVTVKTGHSISSVKLSEGKIGYMGSKTPDILFILSKEGLAKAGAYLRAMRKGQKIYALSSLPKIKTAADVTTIDLDKLQTRIPMEFIAIAVLSAYLKSDGLFPLDALSDSIKLTGDTKIAEKQLRFSEDAGPVIFAKMDLSK